MPTDEKMLSKQKTAKRLLCAAIKMLLLQEDEIATHVVASSASKIVSDLFDKKFPGLSWVDMYIKPEHKNEFLVQIRSNYNFFKHADLDPEGVSDIKNLKEKNWLLILFTLMDFQMIYPKDWSFWFAVFYGYLGLKRPDLIKNVDQQAAPSNFGQILTNMRAIVGQADIDTYFREMVIEILQHEDLVEAVLTKHGLTLSMANELV